jgi:hypothetical protein
VAWDVEYTDQFGEWFDSLTTEQQDAIDATVTHLMRRGPGLGRPLVDTITGSRLANLKELRPPSQSGHRLRVLFVFDPRRSAILLVGGDKTGRWDEWYREAIPEAERLYEEHLEELRKEGLL